MKKMELGEIYYIPREYNKSVHKDVGIAMYTQDHFVYIINITRLLYPQSDTLRHRFDLNQEYYKVNDIKTLKSVSKLGSQIIPLVFTWSPWK
jgi:hypothetical protein